MGTIKYLQFTSHNLDILLVILAKVIQIKLVARVLWVVEPNKYVGCDLLLTLRPRIWLIAADSFNVHSEITFGLISFINNIKAFKGFFT